MATERVVLMGCVTTNASSVCTCVGVFRLRNQQTWNLRDGSDGYERNKNLDCGSDKFLHVKNVKLP
ncbi:hypothetical protein JHK87_039873 [Glycine soja]|nr:hypothetical protein JHK87_039873 [Glycine soja]